MVKEEEEDQHKAGHEGKEDMPDLEFVVSAIETTVRNPESQSHTRIEVRGATVGIPVTDRLSGGGVFAFG